jgi:homoserine kinase
LQVTVPATSANLGPGFDVLGLALDLHNVFTVAPAEETAISISGYGEGLPLDGSNLFCKAFSRLYSLAAPGGGGNHTAPPVNVQMELRVPPGMGLGSSATAVVGGLVAANAFLGEPFDRAALLREAADLEHGGHADNVAPALMGGLVVNVLDGEQVISVSVPFPAEMRAVLFMPDFTMDTVQGRTLMPAAFPRADVVFNTSRVALFVSALNSGRYDLLRIAMQDRLHQPYRARIFPPLPDLIEAALDAGAHGACLSGGGSSVLALADSWAEPNSGRPEEIGEAMCRAGEAAGIKGEVHVLDIDRKGARAVWLEHEDEV